MKRNIDPPPGVTEQEMRRLEDDHIICFIDKKTMTRPMQSPDGKFYNYTTLVDYLSDHKGLGPLGQLIDMKDVVLREDLIFDIYAFVEQNPTHPCIRENIISDWKRLGLIPE
ncbi:MAG: hypothetical protein EZS28_021171 [Streblomastix strix]|uniref:U-box domain-containing protein n=1 Tax=Streblomastix strix TaxID=222440 RepID=A0A5J4VL49_9EUKA|nr:MAG: hypothetical protein EZS28_021171 [Streblomastix strix]